ncbi:filamentous hemagglutinin N-terminal domain-containing protein, partial [Cyanobacteria bacterium FACHB-471]|nr:filamentous hemagglutinin N-terminal domain-containing protein [Cyanobacteria bacterium FACHB-471]
LMRRFGWQTAIVNGIVLSVIVLGWTTAAVAQRRPIADDTLGDESSRVVSPDPQEASDRIEGGAQRGDNLFHSFQEFHVEQGRSVYFADPGVDNILARVTGGVESQILGVLGVVGDANLFLLNPTGIIFGENARLDVRGSFTATTADTMQFGEQGFFSATDPAAPPLLTVQPTAFLFNQLNPAPIANNSRTPSAINPFGIPEFGLRVPAGEGLTLLGGNVSMDGGGLVALGGRVEVGGLSEPGTVTLNADGSLGFPSGVVRSDVSLSNQSRINVVGDGGSITVNAGALEILDSILAAGIGRNSDFVGAQAGDITLDASTIQLRGRNTSITNSVFVGGTGNAGDVIINAGDRAAFDGSFVFSNVGRSDSNTVAVGDGGNIQITTPSLSLTNGAQLQAITYGQGNAGDVIINAPDRVSLNNSSIFSRVGGSANTTGVGNGGDIRITTSSLSLTDGGLNVDVSGRGNGGDIHITTDSVSLSNTASLDASISGQGTAGNVIIQARDRVAIDSSAIFNIVVGDSVNGFGVGNGGDIRITTGSLFLTNGAQLQTLTLAQGNAGNVIINARDHVSLAGVNPVNQFSSGIYSGVGADNSPAVAVGSGGDIRITTGSLSLTNGAVLSASTRGRGDAGSVIINARDRVSLDGSNPTIPRISSAILNTVGSDNSAAAVGNGGDIRITTGSLFLTNGGQLAATVFGRGNAGNVIIHARDRVFLAGANATSPEVRSAFLSNVNELGVGDGGDIRVTAGSLSLNDRAQVNTSTIGQGDAGNIILRAPTGSLVVTGGSQISAITNGQGDAGNVVINVRDRVSLSGVNPNDPESSSAIFSSVGTTNSSRIGRGNGGNIRITAGSLFLTGGTQLVANTNGQGDAGSVIVHVRDRVSFDGGNSEGIPSGISSNVSISAENRVAVGDGGDIRITAGSLSLTNGALLNSSTNGQGNAGNITINARGSVFVEGGGEFASAIISSTEAGAQGRGGNISIRADSVRLANRGSIFSSTRNRLPGGTVTVNTNTFEAIEGAQVNTSSNNQGRAGNIILDVADRITLSGVTDNRPSSLQGNASGLYASTARGASAPSGTIQITTEQLQVFDRARIAVDSRGSGIGGDIDITATGVQLNDQARLTAETVADNGGNITLHDVELLQLRNNSRISTTAGSDRAGGNGGNIDIDADFIVAVPNENSDIRANAFSGSGGSVGIITQGLFGIAVQPQDNPRTSDITASSEQGVQGSISITEPDVDPRRGLTELPTAVVDASNQISQTCLGQSGGETSAFVVSGRGGLPPSPIDSLIGDESLSDWVTLNEEDGKERGDEEAISPLATFGGDFDTAATPIVEVQGWIVGEDGNVTLIATTPASAAQPPAICQ